MKPAGALCRDAGRSKFSSRRIRMFAWRSLRQCPGPKCSRCPKQQSEHDQGRRSQRKKAGVHHKKWLTMIDRERKLATGILTWTFSHPRTSEKGAFPIAQLQAI